MPLYNDRIRFSFARVTSPAYDFERKKKESATVPYRALKGTRAKEGRCTNNARHPAPIRNVNARNNNSNESSRVLEPVEGIRNRVSWHLATS